MHNKITPCTIPYIYKIFDLCFLTANQFSILGLINFIRFYLIEM